MKNTIMKTIAVTLAAFALLVSVQFTIFAQEGRSEGLGLSVVGTWQTMVTPRNCQTGDPVAPAFPGILTFSDGGTLTGTSTTAPAVFGSWSTRHGWRNFDFAFISQRIAPGGVYLGTQTVRQSGRLANDGKSFVSSGTVEVIDAAGNQVGAGCASSTGTLFE
jgi:hypothetical protein